MDPQVFGEGEHLALIGDIVKSRGLSLTARGHLQGQLETLMVTINTKFSGALASRFTVTLGDEFQGLIAKAEIVPDLLLLLESALRPVPVRIGIGFGGLTTPVKPDAIGMDGPAFHNARYAVGHARKQKLLGGVFSGFGEPHDRILNGYARVLWYHRNRWSPQQREVIQRLAEGRSQAEIATTLGVSRQAINSRVTAAGWEIHQEALRGWLAALSLATT